uniref:Uncharacterized protein n=1 Tax=Mola mola TaxID=94237 RepID=A0A3Q4B8P1_MOLML
MADRALTGPLLWLCTVKSGQKSRSAMARSSDSASGRPPSSSSSSSAWKGPEHAAGSCTSQCAVGSCSPASAGDSSELAGPTMVSYLQINRILKQAHFQSLQSRGRTQRHTMT